VSGPCLGALFRALAPHSPTLVGTFPLGLQTATSDIDVACCAEDLDAFEAALATLLRSWTTPARVARVPFSPVASVTTFMLGALPVEVFCQPTAVHLQHGFRHMIVEGRLLALGGEPLRRAVVAAKRGGMKTEPAFAATLGLDAADPYAALLALEAASHEELAALVTRALAT